MTDLTSIILLIATVSGTALYGIINRRTPRVTLQEGPLDQRIPFLPAFVIPYLCIFPFTIFALFEIWQTPFRMEALLACSIAAWTGAATWFLLPMGIERPVIAVRGVFTRIVAFIYRIDANTTTFPSSHVYFAVIAAYFLSAAHDSLSFVWWTIAVVISVSTVFIKQHLFVDVLAGVVWAVAAIGAATSLATLL